MHPGSRREMTLSDVAIIIAELKTENRMLKERISTEATRTEIETYKKIITLLREEIVLKDTTILALKAMIKQV